jgi:mono/diheme cytochrome c family protein
MALDQNSRGFMSATSRKAAFSIIVVLFAGSAFSSFATETPGQRGEVIANGLCSQCHAIGRAGASQHPAAPRFRSLDNQTDLSKLARRIREGLLTGHEDMPMFRFDRDDADAIVAYIRSIQGP